MLIRAVIVQVRVASRTRLQPPCSSLGILGHLVKDHSGRTVMGQPMRNSTKLEARVARSCRQRWGWGGPGAAPRAANCSRARARARARARGDGDRRPVAIVQPFLRRRQPPRPGRPKAGRARVGAREAFVFAPLLSSVARACARVWLARPLSSAQARISKKRSPLGEVGGSGSGYASGGRSA